MRQPTIASFWPAARLFGVAWDELELSHVQAFLALEGREHESLTWEAKGGDIRPDMIHKAVSAFANSVLGGYLILGAAHDSETGVWQTPGVEYPSEPGVWLSQVASAMIGAPGIDVRAWRIDGARHLALVAIPPAAVPPVITPKGGVFVRVAGASLPVKDPTELRAIFERGKAARDRAAGASRDMRDTIMRAPLAGDVDPHQPTVTLAVGLASTGSPSDVTARLMTSRFHEALVAAAQALHRSTLRRDPEWRITSRALQVWVGDERSEGVSIRADATGAVGIALRDPSEAARWWSAANGSDLSERWHATDALVAGLGGYGEAVLSVYVHPGHHQEVWTTIGGVDQDIARVKRDLRRSGGEPSWEDDADGER